MKDDQEKITYPRRFLPLTEEEVFASAGRMMREEKAYLDPWLTMESLAGRMNIHRNILSRAINRFAVVSFPDWLAGYRIAEAERLAGEGGKSMDQLARSTGFSNRTSFYRAFRKLRGASPGVALKRGNNNNE